MFYIRGARSISGKWIQADSHNIRDIQRKSPNAINSEDREASQKRWGEKREIFVPGTDRGDDQHMMQPHLTRLRLVNSEITKTHTHTSADRDTQTQRRRARWRRDTHISGSAGAAGWYFMSRQQLCSQEKCTASRWVGLFETLFHNNAVSCRICLN